MPVATLSRPENAITMGLMPNVIVSAASGGMMLMMRLSVHCATNSEANPPTRASSTLSVSSCSTRWRRVAPSASRTPISVARPAPRASSRLAMLAQAMSSTMAVTEKSSRIGVFASRWMELWPRAPGSSSTFLALKLAIVLSLIPFCSGASTSVMMGE